MILSHVGQAAVDALVAKHPHYKKMCWNVTHGKVVGEIVQTPPGKYCKDAQINEPEELIHSDYFPELIGDIISRATEWVDFTTLGPPTGKFTECIAKALKKLSDSGRSVTVRFLTGNIIGMPTDNHVLLQELTTFPGHEIPADTKIKLWVGSWRKGLSWNHSKIVAVDGKYLLQGGHNVWDPHYLQKNPVRDLSMEAEGQVTRDGHVFADHMWKYIIAKDKEYWEAKVLPGWVPSIRNATIGVTKFPREADEYPPLYEVPKNEVPLVDAVAEGNLPMVTIGRFGALHHNDGTGNPSDSAIVAMLKSAKKSIKMSLQDLGPLAIPTALGPKSIPGGVWPADYLRELATAIYTRGVDVLIILSNPNSIPADLGMMDANYGNGWTCEDTASEIVKAIKQAHPDASDDQLTGLVGVNLKVAYTRGSCGTMDWKEREKAGNHSKFFIVDDVAYYIGSQNLYIADLSEWGIIIDSEEQTQKVLSEYWNKLWQASYEDVPEEKRDCSVDKVLAGLALDRNPAHQSDYTEAELEAMLLAQTGSQMGGPKNKLTVWLKKASYVKNADTGSSGSSDSYVTLRVVDENGKTVGSTHESRTLWDGGRNPEWNEQFEFEGLKNPAACKLVLNMLDKDSLFGLKGGFADWLVRDDKLGSATVDLGTLKKTRAFQDMEISVLQGIFHDTMLSISVNTQGQWGK